MTEAKKKPAALSRQTTWVLLFLAKTGYSTPARAITGETGLASGTLYPILLRLEGAGLIASEWEGPGFSRRRVYWITAKGRLAVMAEVRAWQRLITKFLKLPPDRD